MLAKWHAVVASSFYSQKESCPCASWSSMIRKGPCNKCTPIPLPYASYCQHGSFTCLPTHHGLTQIKFWELAILLKGQIQQFWNH